MLKKTYKYYYYMQNITNLSLLLNKYAGDCYSIVPFDLNHPSLLILDLSAHNKHLQENTFLNTELFSQYIFGEMAKANTPVAIGRYNENRIIYSRSNHFQGSEIRSIHLGI